VQAEAAKISDSELLRAIAHGEESALAEIYDRYRLILFGLVFRILHDCGEAEDILQEVFLQVWRRAGDFNESRGRAFTWLVTIARSRALDRLRVMGSRGRLANDVAQLPREELGDAVADALHAEERTVVHDALSALPNEQRETLCLAYFEGLTQTEIASRLGDPLGTVKTRMRSGMIKLRELVQKKVHD
jgi:RNA polymerase sigma-70 factor (ECF subfamily)